MKRLLDLIKSRLTDIRSAESFLNRGFIKFEAGDYSKAISYLIKLLKSIRIMLRHIRKEERLIISNMTLKMLFLITTR
jgi:hypothetical protein